MHDPRNGRDGRTEPVFTPPREPALNVPAAVLLLAGLFIGIELVRSELLSPAQDWQVILWFSFIPVRYAVPAGMAPLPGGTGAEIWTFLTYALLHGGWVHVLVNVVWMLAFGSAVARRFGAVRFLLLSAVAAVGGAGLHLIANPGSVVPVVGASAAISGQMAAATRFVFEPGAPLGGWRFSDMNSAACYRRPASSLFGVARNRQATSFIAIWFALNLLFGVVNLPFLGNDGAGIAWEAHIGGFLIGLLLFPLFDPVGRKSGAN